MSLLSAGCESNGAKDEDGEGETGCGDGVQAPTELCDDGNLTAGDGCSPECVPSGTQVACLPVLEGHWLNQAHALVAMPDRTFMVAGEAIVGSDSRGWIGRFDAAGEQLWFRQIVPTRADYGRVRDLVVDGEGGSWALVHDGATAELMHFDSSGASDRTIDIPAAFDIPLQAYAIAFDTERIWIGGTTEGDLWLGRYDLYSDQAQTFLREDHLGYADEIRALSRAGDQLGVAATVSTSPNTSGEINVVASTDIVLIRFDLQGNEIGRRSWPGGPNAQFARVAEQLVPDERGQWFLGGALLPIDQNERAQSWVARMDPEPAWSWTSYSVLGEDSGAGFGGLVVVDGEVVTAAGATLGSDDDVLREGWLVKLDTNGELAWRQTNTSVGYEHYAEQQLAVLADGQLRVVGKAWTPDDASVLESCIVAW